jgi:hypothetical protein
LGGTTEPRLALSIVVPAFNEAVRFDVGAERMQAAVDQGAVDPGVTEIIVVDDGSTDGTADRARELFRQFPHSTVLRLADNSGKGAAIRTGVAAARGAVVAFMDADMAVDPRQIPLLVCALDHADLAIASRSLPGSSADGDTLRRTVMGWAFNRLVNATTRVSLGDTQCGFKAFRAPIARLLFQSTVIDRFAFDVEVLCTARRFGLRIAEVPVQWHNTPGSRIRPLRDPLSMVWDMLRSRIGISAPDPIEAVVVSGDDASGSPLEVTRRLVEQTTPVVASREDEALVLFPLCAPDEADHAVDRLRHAFGEASLRRMTLTVTQLVDMAPLTVAFDGSSGVPTGDRDLPCHPPGPAMPGGQTGRVPVRSVRDEPQGGGDQGPEILH